MMESSSCCVLFCVLTLCQGVLSSTLIVNTRAGKIQGNLVPDVEGREYVSFTGIPYAKPPTGNLRFAKPEPHPKFETTFNATVRGAICPQVAAMMYPETGEDEDCLILNVYTKDLARMGKKVLVFIHGGAFLLGESVNMKFGTLVNHHDIIVVALNYRIGILGFLSSGDEASPGNYGLWDQLLALKWVKENINYFGGDPEDITISGESAGAASVTLHTISPHSRGLFTKVYAHSGAASGPYVTTPFPHMDMLAFAKATGCWEGDLNQRVDVAKSKTIVECLRGVDISAITSYPIIPAGPTPFVPVVDGDFLPRMPLDLLKDEKYLKSIGFFERSHLMGYNNNELGYIANCFAEMEYMIQSNKNMSEDQKIGTLNQFRDRSWNYYITHRIPGVSSRLISKIKSRYDRRHGSTGILAPMVHDVAFVVPTYDILKAASQSPSSESRLLHFDYYPSFMKGTARGMLHGLDMLFWLDGAMELAEKLLRAGIQGDMDEEDLNVRRSFSTLIANFVKFGDPSLSLHLPNGWPKFEVETSYFLNFNLKPKVKTDLAGDAVDFWVHDVPELVAMEDDAADSDTKHTEL